MDVQAPAENLVQYRLLFYLVTQCIQAPAQLHYRLAVIGCSYWLQLLVAVIGCSYWLQLLVAVIGCILVAVRKPGCSYWLQYKPEAVIGCSYWLQHVIGCSKLLVAVIGCSYWLQLLVAIGCSYSSHKMYTYKLNCST